MLGPQKSPSTSRPPEKQPAPALGWALIAATALLLVILLAMLLNASRLIPQLRQALNLPRCGESTLIFEKTKFRIQLVEPAADGSFTAPSGPADVAYWYKEDSPSLVFALNPTPANLALGKTLKAGDLVSIMDADCSITSFTLEAPELNSSYNPLPAGQPSASIVLFTQNSSSGEGFVVKGSPVQGQIVSTASPAPEGPGVQAEISFLGTTTSPDKATIQVRVSIRNYGDTPFMLSEKDIALIPGDSESITLSKASLSLPIRFDPGITQELSFTFPRPSSPSATLKIVDIEYEIDGY